MPLCISERCVFSVISGLFKHLIDLYHTQYACVKQYMFSLWISMVTIWMLYLHLTKVTFSNIYLLLWRCLTNLYAFICSKLLITVPLFFVLFWLLYFSFKKFMSFFILRSWTLTYFVVIWLYRLSHFLSVYQVVDPFHLMGHWNVWCHDDCSEFLKTLTNIQTLISFLTFLIRLPGYSTHANLSF